MDLFAISVRVPTWRVPLHPGAFAALRLLARQLNAVYLNGTIHQCGALPEEAEEKDLANLMRLRFRFDRRNHGRLRQMIDAINHLPHFSDR